MWPVLQSLKYKQAYNELSSIDTGEALRQDSIPDASKGFAWSEIKFINYYQPQGIPS